MSNDDQHTWRAGTDQPTTDHPVNRVIVCGWVQGERTYRDQRATATTETRTDTQGRTNWLTLHIPGPFGAIYALDVHVTAATCGRDALDRTLRPGNAIVVTGQLEWTLNPDVRFARDALDEGRLIPDAYITAASITAASAEDVPGCDVWLCGIVRDTARIERHAEQPISYYRTRIDVAITQTRPRSNARFTMSYPVDVAIPLAHPDAPRLLRRGNTVAVAGLMERGIRYLSRTDEAVVQTVARHEAALHMETETLKDNPRQQRAVQRRTEAHIRELRRVPMSRVVVGQVTLVHGKELDPAALSVMQKQDKRRRLARRPAPQPSVRLTPAIEETVVGTNGATEDTASESHDPSAQTTRTKPKQRRDKHTPEARVEEADNTPNDQIPHPITKTPTNVAPILENVAPSESDALEITAVPEAPEVPEGATDEHHNSGNG